MSIPKWFISQLHDRCIKSSMTSYIFCTKINSYKILYIFFTLISYTHILISPKFLKNITVKNYPYFLDFLQFLIANFCTFCQSKATHGLVNCYLTFLYKLFVFLLTHARAFPPYWPYWCRIMLRHLYHSSRV